MTVPDGHPLPWTIVDEVHHFERPSVVAFDGRLPRCEWRHLDPVPSGTPCDATLRHAHGVARCFERGPHTGHRGWCDSCVEDGDDTVLSWTGEGRTEWPL